jgi:hypothetical protein
MQIDGFRLIFDHGPHPRYSQMGYNAKIFWDSRQEERGSLSHAGVDGGGITVSEP